MLTIMIGVATAAVQCLCSAVCIYIIIPDGPRQDFTKCFSKSPMKHVIIDIAAIQS